MTYGEIPSHRHDETDAPGRYGDRLLHASPERDIRLPATSVRPQQEQEPAAEEYQPGQERYSHAAAIVYCIEQAGHPATSRKEALLGRITDAGKRKPQMLDIVLTGMHVRSPHALELKADRLPDPVTGEMPPFTFRPGQWVYLIDAQGFRADQRAFSLASAPSEATIELGIEIVPGGLFTPRALQWRIGDEFTLRGPYGTFQLQEPLTRDLLLIGGNAGVVPFRSFVRHLAASPSPPSYRVSLLACHHHRDLAFYDEEFEALMSAHSWFEYQLIDTGNAAPGTLPQAQRLALTERNQGALNLCYVAGVQAFTSAVEAVLAEAGVPPGQLAIERFD